MTRDHGPTIPNDEAPAAVRAPGAFCQRAREPDGPGRSDMGKAELVEALRSR